MISKNFLWDLVIYLLSWRTIHARITWFLLVVLFVRIFGRELQGPTLCSGVRMFVDTSDADSVRRCSVMCAEHKPIWRELSAPQLLSAWTQSNTARPHAQRTAARTFAVCRLYAYSYRHMSCDMRAGYSDIVLIATTEYFVCIDHISYHIFVYLTLSKRKVIQ